MADPERRLRRAVSAPRARGSPSRCATPTWNGHELAEVYPWGTIRRVTPEANRATAEELRRAERDEIRAHTWQYLDVFDYRALSN